MPLTVEENTQESTTMGKTNKPPATTTVHRALLTEPPVVFGERLQPVTVAHVIALEALESPLVLFHRRPGNVDILEAWAVLRRQGEQLLQIGAGGAEEILTPAKAKEEAMRLALTVTPDQMQAASEAVQGWLYQSYEAHVPARSDGSGPLAPGPDETASAGPSKS